MIGIRENKITRVPLMEAVKLVRHILYSGCSYEVSLTVGILRPLAFQTREVAPAISERDFEKAMSLRDPEFRETLDGFYATSMLESEPKLPHHLVSAAGLWLYASLTFTRSVCASESCSKWISQLSAILF